MKKRILAIILSIVLCFSCVLPVFAVDGEEPETETTTEAEVTSEEDEVTTVEPTTEAEKTDSGFSFDFSLEDLLNSDLILGILGSDGFMDLTAIVIEVMATFNKDNLQAMGKEQLEKVIQSTFDTIAGAISQLYGNKDLIITYDPLKVLKNLFDLDDDVLTTAPRDDATTKDPNELEIGMGDVDGDGKITAADARQVLRRAAQLILFTTEQDARADVDKDGKVTARDARIILRYSAGLITDEEFFGTK